MAESDDAQLQRTSLLGLVRNHVTLVLTLIPILLSGLRIFAVANGDRPTLVTLLSTLDVKAVLLGTFAWLLPTAFGVAAAICWIRWLQLRSVSQPPPSAGQRTTIFWLAVCITLLALMGQHARGSTTSAAEPLNQMATAIRAGDLIKLTVVVIGKWSAHPF